MRNESHREKCVVQSPNLSVLSGVPQGTVIGPALFLVCINDQPDVKFDGHLFADDTAIIDWLMAVNPEKSEVLRISRRREVISHDYVPHGVILETVDSTKYLGVLICDDLKWNIHISKTVAKGHQTLGFWGPS